MKAEQKEMTHEQKISLFGDLLVLYLSVGSVLGDCELYKQMGRALNSENPNKMRDMIAEFNTLSRTMRERILRGDTSFETQDGNETGEDLENTVNRLEAVAQPA